MWSGYSPKNDRTFLSTSPPDPDGCGEKWPVTTECLSRIMEDGPGKQFFSFSFCKYSGGLCYVAF